MDALPLDSSGPPTPRWSLATRVVFRFFALYYFLYVLATQMLGALVPFLPARLGPVLDRLIAWTGTHVFAVTAKPVMSGSGDKLYDWVQAFCLVVIAAAGTVVWSVLDRKRARYDRLYRWTRVFLRFALGSSMIGYGFVKAFPLQMPAPALTRLLEPYGNFSPMGVLWYSIGASFPYERFVGLVEVIGGALVFFPRTQVAGLLVLLGATFQVFMLNMTYDVPVKLFSLHLFVLTAFLLAPYARDLCALAFKGRARSWWAALAQAALGAYLLWTAGWGAAQGVGTYGYKAPKPELYGIWTIDRMTIDGVERAPLITDYERWRRVVVQNTSALYFWRMDDTVLGLPAKFDAAAHTITLSNGQNVQAGVLTYERPSPDQLVFDGTANGKRVHLETHRFDHTQMMLLSRGFHWVQEFPVNR